jgi:hypothetical protein
MAIFGLIGLAISVGDSHSAKSYSSNRGLKPARHLRKSRISSLTILRLIDDL